MVGVSCRACGDGQPGPPAWRDGESCPGGGRSVLLGLWGGIFGHTAPGGRGVLPRGWSSVLQVLWERRTGHTGLGGWGVQPRGWSEFPAGPAGMDNRAHRPEGMESPAQGVVGASCRACEDVEPGTPSWGDGESCPGVGRSVLQGLWGRRTGHTGLGGWAVLSRGWPEFPAGPAGMDNRAHQPGGMGSPAQGVVGASCRACGDVEPGTPPWGDGESCPGVGRSVLQVLWGRRTGHTGLEGWGVQPRGWSEFPAAPAGMDNRAHRPGGMATPAQGVVGVSCWACGDVEPGTRAWGDGEFSPGGGRSFLQGLRGWTTGHTGLGEWGGLPRGWSERPAGPVGT